MKERKIAWTNRMKYEQKIMIRKAENKENNYHRTVHRRQGIRPVAGS